MGAYSGVTQGSYDVVNEAVFIPEVWTDAIRASFKKSLILGSLANDYSSLVAGAGDKIHIPTIADVANAAEKAKNTAVSYTEATEVEITLDVNQHYYTSAMVEDMARIQSSSDLLGGYADSMGYKLALHLEEALADKLGTTLNGFNLDTDDSTVDRQLSKKRLAGIVTYLYSLNMRPEDCYLVLSNILYASLFALDDFVHVSKIGTSNFANGTVGTILGMPVIHAHEIANEMPAAGLDQAGAGLADNLVYGGFVVHKTALGIAYSKPPTTNAEYDMDYVAHKMVTDMVYGCGLIQDTNQKKIIGLVEADQITEAAWNS